MSDLFDHITPYCTGFLFADGHMRIRNKGHYKDYAYMLACELQTRDSAHLEYMCDDLRKRRNIRERKRYRFGKEYRSTISCQIKKKDDEQTYIRTLEEQMFRFFGIEKEFDFTNIY